MEFLLKGLLIGFSIAAPVGPIGILCIRRTIAQGRLIGFLSGLGAATADMLYGAVAAFGLTAVQRALVAHQLWLRPAGGFFLIALGLRTMFSRPAASPPPLRPGAGAAAYFSTFGLTLTNPATILSFTIIFAGLRLVETGGNYAAAGLLVLGVFIGSAAWWLALSSTVGLLRERFTSLHMLWVNRGAGLSIALFGGVILVAALLDFLRTAAGTTP
jgi:threonine/homoserine/homoserine lactone efflux protein